MLLDLKNLLAKSEIIKGIPYFRLDENLTTDDLVIDQMWNLIIMYSCP